MTAAAADLLARVGRTLYGERWQSALARELGVSDRTVRRWAAGEDAPKPGVYADLVKIVFRCEGELRELYGPLRLAAGKPFE